MENLPTIVLTGGGSGGHITPLLSLAHELKQQKPNYRIVYIGHKGDRFDTLKDNSKDFDFVAFIDAGKFRRYHGESLLRHLLDVKTILLNVRDFFKVIFSIVRAYKILRKVKPSVIFSKGGFVVVPVGIAARLLRVPIITHDSDTMPGLANRIVGRWAEINATGMPANYYKYSQSKIRYVGVPLSSTRIKPVSTADLPKLKQAVNLPKDSLVLLIAGGGNGSKRLNDLVLTTAPHILKSSLALQIIHIAGLQHAEQVMAGYRAILDSSELQRVHVLGFTGDFYKYAAAADLVFSRAGATSLAEFAALAKPAIIMPSPFLAGGHQLKNAAELSSRDAAVIINEDISGDEFIVILNELLNNSSRRRQLAKNISTMAHPDAAKKIADLILQLIKTEA